MKTIYKRLLNIKLPKGKSAFLWGPRKVGKTFWIRTQLSGFILIDFLKTDPFSETHFVSYSFINNSISQ